MSKTSTKKKAPKRTHNPNSTGTNQTRSRQAATAAAAAKAEKRHALCNNASSGRPGKKTRKKLSRQQAAEVRDTLNAEFRDLRSGSQTKDTVQQGLQLPDGTDLTPPSPKKMSEADGFDPLAQQLHEHSVQDLTGILSML